MRAALVGMLGLSMAGGGAAAQDVEDILATAGVTYRQITTLEADFTQTLINPMLGDAAMATMVTTKGSIRKNW